MCEGLVHDIRAFQKRSNERSVYNFNIFPVKLEFKSSYYIDSSPCFVGYVLYVFMPGTVS